MTLPRLILASTSPYRRELLARLRLPFETLSPGVDETPRTGETPAALAVRLAEEKAHAIAARHPEAIVIGGDQVAVLDGRALSKPEAHANAVAQLRAMRGRTVTFLTAVAVEHGASGQKRARLVPCDVQFRAFPEEAIEPYLRADRPYDCAGSAKIDSLGIALVERLDGDDPTALVGLPLIALVAMLGELGLDVLRPA
ncbi:MAG: Maf family nucleotide pyrophosphatase [Burkholderiales bacterium]